MWPAKKDRLLAFVAPGEVITAELVDGRPGPITTGTGNIPPTLQTAGDLYILLSGHSLRSTTLPWSDSLNADDSASTYATARWRQVFGDSADWSVLVEPGPFGGNSILLALPRTLEQSLRNCKADTLVIQPLVTAAYAHCASKLPAHCLFAVLEPGCLMLAVVQGRRIRQLSRHRMGTDWKTDIDRLYRRLLLQNPDWAGFGPLQLLALAPGGQMGPNGDSFTLLPWPAPGIDQSLIALAAGLRAGSGFNVLPPRSRRSQLERALLAVAAAVCITTVSTWLRLTHAEAEAMPVGEPAPPAPTLSAREQQGLQREVAAVNRTVAELNLPADAVIGAVSPGQLREVALLAIELGNAGDGKVRVTAAAKSIAGMESYLRLLEQRPQLRAASLAHHETTTDAEWPYRFVLEAQWKAG